MDRSTRRSFLAGVGGVAVSLAGCATTGGPPEESPSDGPAGSPTASPTDTPTTDVPPRERIDVAGRWPQRGFDAGHSGSAPRDGVPGSGRPYWQYRRIRSGPPVLGGGRLYHYAELGKNPDGTATATPTPDTADGPAHIVEGNPHLVARDAATGTLDWWTPLADATAGWPALAGSHVVGTARGEVFAADPASGERRWTDSLEPGDHEGDPFPRPAGGPTVAGDAVVVPLSGVVAGDGDVVVAPKVRAYEPDGTVRWTVEAPKRGLGVAAGSDVAVVVAGDWETTGVVTARSLADGSVRWRTDLAGASFSGPVVAGGTAYVATSEGALVALSLADGRERWRAAVGDDAGLAADGEGVYAAAGDRLLKLAAGDGSERWAVEAPGQNRYRVAPAVADGVVYAGTVGVEQVPFQALDAATGERRWSWPLPQTVVEGDMVMGGARTRPTVGDGAVYVDAVDGLYGFGPDE